MIDQKLFRCLDDHFTIERERERERVPEREEAVDQSRDVRIERKLASASFLFYLQDCGPVYIKIIKKSFTKLNTNQSFKKMRERERERERERRWE